MESFIKLICTMVQSVFKIESIDINGRNRKSTTVRYTIARLLYERIQGMTYKEIGMLFRPERPFDYSSVSYMIQTSKDWEFIDSNYKRKFKVCEQKCIEYYNEIDNTLSELIDQEFNLTINGLKELIRKDFAEYVQHVKINKNKA